VTKEKIERRIKKNRQPEAYIICQSPDA